MHLSGSLHVAQTTDFEIRLQQNQDFSSDQVIEVTENKELRRKS